ncbi:MAG TPA: YjgP/YjgQ family permease [Gemmatimonadetes bacterium]|jgi:lipopolysaccharide export system permease protein|nr:YjgP/YjgQ family permease [Gemmatimonadota bacterium]HIN77239.1 YjgP/YjgQ family permease [Gemmatimonadota bacterium]
MRILDRLVAWTFLRSFLLFIFAAPPLLILGDLTENLDDYLDRGIALTDIAVAYFYQLPQFIQWSFPIAGLIAAVFTVHNMTRHRELVAAKAGGISFHRIILPLVVLGVMLTVVALGLTEIVPKGNRIAAQILRDEDPMRSWRSDFVYQSENGLIWQVDRLTAGDGSMSNIIIERPPTASVSGLHVIADAAMWNPRDGWTLRHGFFRTLTPDSAEKSIEFDRLQMAELTEKPEEFLKTPREPEEMTYAEIDHLATIIQRTGGNAKELLVKREQKLAIPFATLVVILFGAPLATSSRRGGTALGVGISLGTVLFYILMLKVSAAFGEIGALSPVVAAWLPNVVFLGVAVILLVRVRT